jgi:AcrR family transcriptional regulator
MAQSQLKRISAIHKEAMRLRLRGLTYGEIAEHIDRSQGTIHNWFYGDKLFRESFEEYKEQLTEQAEAQLVDATNEAVTTLRSMLNARSEYVRLQAAQDILNRRGITAPQRHELTGRDGKPMQFEMQTWIELVRHADGGSSDNDPQSHTD